MLFIMTDDHAARAVGAYEGRLASLNPTPALDKLASQGILFSNCFVANSICTPSRASMLTGQYSQTNGVLDLDGRLPQDRQYLPKLMRKLGYETALIGKWHLKTTPDFDYYKIMYEAGGQGTYFDPKFIETGTPYIRERNDTPEAWVQHEGHSSDVITDLTLEWLKAKRNPDKPFFLMHHYKAPHDMFEHAPRYDDYLADVEIPEPASLFKQPDFGSPGTLGHNNELSHFIGTSISSRHTVRNYINEYIGTEPHELEDTEATRIAYQEYLKRYLRCVKGVDDNLARLFAYLKESGLWENTIIIYTSDQGMMLGEHDYIDKRWIYEPSIHMPFIVYHPDLKEPGLRNDMMISNVDFAPTLLGLAGAETPDYMQGRDFSESIIKGKELAEWDNSVYYRYWMHMIHHDIPAHFGIRTERYKLIFYYGIHYDLTRMGGRSTWGTGSNRIVPTPVSWEFYDLEKDPEEVINQYQNPKYSEIITELKERLKAKREALNETDDDYPHIQAIIDMYWHI